MPVITVSAKGQIVIPAELKKHSIKRGDRLNYRKSVKDWCWPLCRKSRLSDYTGH